MENGLQASFARAERRARGQRLIEATGWFLRGAAVFLALVLAATLVVPGVSAWGGGSLAALVAVLVFLAVVAWFRPIPKACLARRIDKHAGLADHAITSAELESEKGSGWLRLQYEDTMARLQSIDWKTAWPLRWPRFSGGMAVAVVLLAALLAGRFLTYHPATMEKDRGLADEVAAIEEVFKDWEQAAELTQDPELKKLLAEVQPMREQLPEMNEREMMLSLSKLENRLETLREAASKDSLEGAAADMAGAFEGIEDMGKLASALRQKDFEKAAELTRKEAEKLGQADAAMPRGADSAATQRQMAAVGDKLEQSGQQSAATAMREMRQSASQQNPQGMGKAMGQMSKNFEREGQRQEASKNLGVQLAQVGQRKSSLGRGQGKMAQGKGGQGQPGQQGQEGEQDGEGEGRGLSLTKRIAEARGGKGAGSETDPNRYKDPTRSDASRTDESLTGQAGDGESMTENMSSDAPGSEAPREDRNAQFAKYEKLSLQAIEDESLPLAYREAIRKYFEAIRPAQERQ